MVVVFSVSKIETTVFVSFSGVTFAKKLTAITILTKDNQSGVILLTNISC